MSRFDERFLDELKARIRPSDLIGKSVKLRRQGREYAGLSPFAKEKSPSFFVNDEKGFYHCFSSGKHGDVISFLQETESLTFVEAVERLASEAGMALPVHDPRSAAEDKRRGGLIEWLELAAKWFEDQLRRPVGGDAQRYLSGRGFPSTEWGRFRIGFAPESRTALKDYLVAKGARPGELVEAGLLIAPEDGSAPYDRFRNRVMFPITDGKGRVISFGGRALDPAARAKYLNGPETSVFHKGRVLYGLAEARRLLPAHAAAPLAVVEGYMDAITCQRAGVAAVAAMGTALGEDQMEILWRIHPEPTLCFDGDAAGQRAARRTIDRALPLLQPRRSFRFATPKGGKDPDDVLREQGPEAVVAQMRDSVALVDALWTMETSSEVFRTPEAKAGLRHRLRELAYTIRDKDLAEAYRRELIARCDAMFAPPQRANSARYARPSIVMGASDALKAATAMMARGDGHTGRRLLQALLNSPKLSDEQARLADLLVARDDLDRSIEGLAADFSAPGAVADIARLKADRAVLDEQIRDAQHQVQGRAA
jgi:DNA primase